MRRARAHNVRVADKCGRCGAGCPEQAGAVWRVEVGAEHVERAPPCPRPCERAQRRQHHRVFVQHLHFAGRVVDVVVGHVHASQPRWVGGRNARERGRGGEERGRVDLAEPAEERLRQHKRRPADLHHRSSRVGSRARTQSGDCDVGCTRHTQVSIPKSTQFKEHEEAAPVSTTTEKEGGQRGTGMKGDTFVDEDGVRGREVEAVV
eukprot:482882-Rhodomonas_salina.2